MPEPLRLFDTDAVDVPHPETANEPLARASLQRVRLTSRLVAKAQDRFAGAVLSARSGGCSWREIGTAASVPYLTLHRRFGQIPTSERQLSGHHL